ncbi:hypothetical protein Ddc_16929 [Ditylenchus destructor]|nr:hypothetical protein Ddc_16929 [Ditylenchus destructor]
MSPSSQFFSSANLLCILASVIVLASLAQCQMTFSDGWGKRSVGLSDLHRRAAEEFNGGAIPDLETEKAMANAALDVCHNAYSQSLVQLHHQIMAMYDSYQKCQDKAVLGVRGSRRT